MSKLTREEWLESAVYFILEDAAIETSTTYKCSVGFSKRRGPRGGGPKPLVDIHRDVANGRVHCFLDPGVSVTYEVLVALNRALSQDWSAITEPSPEWLDRMKGALGEYPAAPLLVPETQKQATRMRKVWCGCSGKAYIVRATDRTLRRGIPICPLCAAAMQVEREEA